MSEERLQEIKDSISLQYKVQEANDLNKFNIFTDEEQELVEEIERLNNIINEFKNRDDVLEEFEDWLERQKTRNSEWDNFIMVDGRLGIPISYLLNKLQELKGNNNGVWVNNLLEVIKKNNIEFGSDK